MRFPERQRGPVTLRRGQVQPGTTDQRLLDSRGPSDWVHTDPWRVLRIEAEFIEGFGLLADLPQAGSVFGSARTPEHHPYYDTARRLGEALARSGFCTLDELFESLVLVQTDKVTHFPVILFGRQYWAGLLEWIRSTVLPGGKISPADVELLTVTDDVDEAVTHIIDATRRRERAVDALVHDAQ